jgi:hypothetical protein
MIVWVPLFASLSSCIIEALLSANVRAKCIFNYRDGRLLLNKYILVFILILIIINISYFLAKFSILLSSSPT